LVERRPLEVPFVTESATGLHAAGFHLDGLELWTSSSPGEPRLADLDGDGAAEILVVTRGAEGVRDLLQVIRLDP
jgi:hypothetical protein